MLGDVGQISGPFFDIHCGGEDHISVHHTNEIAQTQACYGTRLANFWLHGYFLQLDEAKMSKSAGDFVRLQTLIDRGYDPLAYRFFCLSAHYRARLSFTWRGLGWRGDGAESLAGAGCRLGPAGAIDEDYVDRFAELRSMMISICRAPWPCVWDLLKADRPDCDEEGDAAALRSRVGLGIGRLATRRRRLFQDDIANSVQQRQQARAAKQWPLADRTARADQRGGL